MADDGDKPQDEPDRAPREDPGARPRRPPDFDAEEDPPGDADQPVETVVRYETAAERQERLHEERRHRRHRRVTEAGVALAALFVSLAVFLVNGAMFVRGSDIALLDPESVVFYRDAGPNGASLWVAMQARMINAAGDYGDVATASTVAFGAKRQERGRFRYLAVVEPTMVADVEKAVADCPQGARCVANTGFYVVERPRRLLDVPGGGSRSEYLAFHIEAVACDGEPGFCGSFVRFEDGVAHLRSRPDPVLRMSLDFYFDGPKEVRCDLPRDPAQRRAVFDYLEQKGWAEVACAPRRKRGR